MGCQNPPVSGKPGIGIFFAFERTFALPSLDLGMLAGTAGIRLLARSRPAAAPSELSQRALWTAIVPHWNPALGSELWERTMDAMGGVPHVSHRARGIRPRLRAAG
jgi:hypothetical protein